MRRCPQHGRGPPALRLRCRSVAKRKIKPAGDPLWKWKRLLGTEHPQSEGDTRIVCPYCQRQGDVVTFRGREKQGFSPGKVVAAICTLGFTLLLTGLARKGDVTVLECRNCGMTWDA